MQAGLTGTFSSDSWIATAADGRTTLLHRQSAAELRVHDADAPIGPVVVCFPVQQHSGSGLWLAALSTLPQVSAARDAIGDADFFLVARTDARGANAKYGLEVREWHTTAVLQYITWHYIVTWCSTSHCSALHERKGRSCLELRPHEHGVTPYSQWEQLQPT